MILEKHGGKVPATMEELTRLPGVGRKTANLILGDVFPVPGSVVVVPNSATPLRDSFTQGTWSH